MRGGERRRWRRGDLLCCHESFFDEKERERFEKACTIRHGMTSKHAGADHWVGFSEAFWGLEENHLCFFLAIRNEQGNRFSVCKCTTMVSHPFVLLLSFEKHSSIFASLAFARRNRCLRLVHVRVFFLLPRQGRNAATYITSAVCFSIPLTTLQSDPA